MSIRIPQASGDETRIELYFPTAVEGKPDPVKNPFYRDTVEALRQIARKNDLFFQLLKDGHATISTRRVTGSPSEKPLEKIPFDVECEVVKIIEAVPLQSKIFAQYAPNCLIFKTDQLPSVGESTKSLDDETDKEKELVIDFKSLEMALHVFGMDSLAPDPRPTRGHEYHAAIQHEDKFVTDFAQLIGEQPIRVIRITRYGQVFFYPKKGKEISESFIRLVKMAANLEDGEDGGGTGEENRDLDFGVA